MTDNNDEERYERGRLKMLEERKKHPFSLSQLQFSRIKFPASEEEIKTLQDYVGHPLPELYKEICRYFNGGKPRFKCCEDVDGRLVKIGYFLCVTNEKKDYTIWTVIKNFREELGADCLPFVDDSLGLSTFYLKWVNGKVQVWRLLYGELASEFSGFDDDDDENEESYYCHVLINESFDAFLESLYAVEE